MSGKMNSAIVLARFLTHVLNTIFLLVSELEFRMAEKISSVQETVVNGDVVTTITQTKRVGKRTVLNRLSKRSVDLPR